MRSKTWLLAFAFFLGMCREKESPREQALKIFDESMALHDEVMPLMDDLYTLEGKLKTLRDSLQLDSTVNATRIAIVVERLTSLRQASQHMMDWMHNIQDVPGSNDGDGRHHQHENHAVANSTDEEIIKVQQAQKSRIEKVRDEMIESIASTKEEINK